MGIMESGEAVLVRVAGNFWAIIYKMDVRKVVEAVVIRGILVLLNSLKISCFTRVIVWLRGKVKGVTARLVRVMTTSDLVGLGSSL